MLTRTTTYILASVFVLSWTVSRAQAELPPGAYEKLLSEAQELLQIRIDKVTEKERISADMRNFVCDATVVKVERSKADLKPGDKIQFDSYFVPPEAYARGFVGPKSPTLLDAGWQGDIYLNRVPDAADYALAAYGRSFVRLGGGGPLPTVRLGVRATSAEGGGLVVRNVDRGSLADDLGIRGGDKLIEINGSPVNAITDVAKALESDKTQLMIVLERRGRRLTLSLSRAK